jgi:hypothetical protein
MPKFNEFQKAAIDAYPNHDLKYMLEEGADAEDVGDSLFSFIVRELSDDGMDIDTAIERMETVRDEVEAVLHALNELK